MQIVADNLHYYALPSTVLLILGVFWLFLAAAVAALLYRLFNDKR